MQTRYARQIVLKEIGEAGQRRIASSTVVVVGLGALGSNSANLLARAGIGTLRLATQGRSGGAPPETDQLGGPVRAYH